MITTPSPSFVHVFCTRPLIWKNSHKIAKGCRNFIWPKDTKNTILWFQNHSKVILLNFVSKNRHPNLQKTPDMEKLACFENCKFLWFQIHQTILAFIGSQKIYIRRTSKPTPDNTGIEHIFWFAEEYSLTLLDFKSSIRKVHHISLKLWIVLCAPYIIIL